MQDSERINEDYCTPEQDPRPRLRWRFITSVIVLAFLLGAMIGKLFEPAVLRIDDVQATERGLILWFNREPAYLPEPLLGTLAYRFEESLGRERSGQLQLPHGLVNWRLERDDNDLRLVVVSPRAMNGEWRGVADDGRWRVELTLRPE